MRSCFEVGDEVHASEMCSSQTVPLGQVALDNPREKKLASSSEFFGS